MPYYNINVEADFVTEAESPGLVKQKLVKVLKSQKFNEENFSIIIKRMSKEELKVWKQTKAVQEKESVRAKEIETDESE